MCSIWMFQLVCMYLLLMRSTVKSHSISVTLNNFTVYQAKNPMEAFVNQKEGVSLKFSNGKGLFYIKAESSPDFPNLPNFPKLMWSKTTHKTTETKILVGPSVATDVYPMTFNGFPEEDVNVKINKNNDGTVSLTCPGGRFVSSKESAFSMPFICTESGICQDCKFELVDGSVIDLSARILSIEWGQPRKPVSSSPSVVVENTDDNWSDTESETILSFSTTTSVTETTIWENPWGFGLSAEFPVEVEIPLDASGHLKSTATVSYNGTQSDTTTGETIKKEKKVICPSKTRCTLKLICTKLDNYMIPFSALVQRTQENGPPIQSIQKGIWSGVTAVDYRTVYCTQNLITGYSNCPSF